MELSYILKLRNALKPELRHMPLFQNGSAIIGALAWINHWFYQWWVKNFSI